MADDLIIRGRDKLQEISMKLEQSHLVYLQTDDSPLKLQQRHKLEGFIKEYLCLIPNENKYVFRDTADILHRSAANIQDFSGYRAATAWSTISLYAANLLAQPWRKEYRTLRTYSGYYKHEVEANLIGAELMFEQMGYKHTGIGVLTLEGPIDPDKVSCVSRDAIVAFVECQILKQIWESVSKNFSISWLEVLQFRENHVGTVEQAIRALNHRFCEKLHQSRIKSAACRGYHYPQPLGIDIIPPAVPYHLSHNYDTTTGHQDCRYNEDLNIISPHYRYNPVDHGIVNRCSTYNCWLHGNKYFNNCPINAYCSSVPSYPTGVPTGRLIELDMPVSVTNHEKLHPRKLPNTVPDFDDVDHHQKQSTNGDYCEHTTISKSPNISVPKDDYNTWDFVYKNLESQGYSKDLGDREDVLHERLLELNSLKNVQHKLDKHNVYGTEKRKNGTEKRKNGRADPVSEDNALLSNEGNYHSMTLPLKKKSASFDLSDKTKQHIDLLDKHHVPSNVDVKHGNQAQSMSRTHSSLDEIARVTDSLKNVDLSQPAKEKTTPAVVDIDKWNCATCTFLNISARNICEMCGKSRRKGNEDKPLASGGTECLKCTLVNEKNVSVCVACETSLKDSPTYI